MSILLQLAGSYAVIAATKGLTFPQLESDMVYEVYVTDKKTGLILVSKEAKTLSGTAGKHNYI